MLVHHPPVVHHPVTRPATDILETDEHIVIHVNMAGVPCEDIILEVDHNEISIRGCSRHDFQREAGGILALEFTEVDYQLRLALPEIPEYAKIRATLRNGVLTIFIPRVQSGVHRIVVEPA